VPRPNARAEIRAAARRFEEALPAGRRKQLGQYFTGIRLGKLLAHLALAPDTRTVIDPMAGHGDLLDAAAEAADERGIALERLDGIEIDPQTAQACRERLTHTGLIHTLVCASAFDSATLVELGHRRRYGLAITNPPYVRYQSRNGAPDSVRAGLESIIAQEVSGAEKTVWSALASGYSGLADLSVPSWLLAALLVRPGGRIAIVAPATWRSRDYGDVIRYLLLRCFALECVVEDTQPGWFSDALVRTHLIVARRLSAQAAARKLEDRTEWGSASWLSIAPEAADERSLVGAAFVGKAPEARFAEWLRGGAATARRGILARRFPLHEEWLSLKAKAARRSWLQTLEGSAGDLPLFSGTNLSPVPAIPEAVRDLVAGAPLSSLKTLGQSGIQVGQGLRTGCNRFFYVDASGAAGGGMVRIKVSAAYQGREIPVPAEALRPVLRRQAELPLIGRGALPAGRVLDLRRWALPEDMEIVALTEATYRQCGELLPQIMPADLAAYVRLAAQTPLDEAEGGKRAPELSAVRTNARAHREGAATPRFWYMLPDFMPRHIPAALVPRIVSDAPRVECNLEEPILIDANFSTFWADRTWPRFALKALLNSAWCQLLMEALGTPMGGGALKLEAAHLKQLPVPALPVEARRALDDASRAHARGQASALADIDAIILGAVLGRPAAADHARAMKDRAERLRRSRLRTAA
jgi:methylase of polypeptide subunit release factors